MTGQDIDTFQLPHDKLEVFRFFEHCDFRDPLGHKLTLDTAFIQLVDFYCKVKPSDPFWQHNSN